MNVIEAQNVSKRFVLHHDRGSIKERFLSLVNPSRRSEAEDFWALRDVTLQIPANTRIAWSPDT